VGALQTADGHWTAYGVSAFGDYAGLFDGDTILQVDSLTFNHTHVWGFFNGSTETMACAGHPEQVVPPGQRIVGNNTEPTTIDNVVQSQPIDLRTDVNGQPVPWSAQTLMVDHDVLPDISFENLINYIGVQFLVSGCWRPISYSGNPSGLPSTPKWVRIRTPFAIPAGATHVRVVLRAFEWTSNLYPSCRSPYPLFDNVEVRVVTDLATATGPVLKQTHLEQNHPNPFNPVTTIGYTLATSGHVTLRVYDVTGALVRTLVDGVQSADAGALQATWDGRADTGAAVSSGVYFYRLEAGGTIETRRMVLLK
jgi:hypothetical protein